MRNGDVLILSPNDLVMDAFDLGVYTAMESPKWGVLLVIVLQEAFFSRGIGFMGPCDEILADDASDESSESCAAKRSIVQTSSSLEEQPLRKARLDAPQPAEMRDVVDAPATPVDSGSAAADDDAGAVPEPAPTAEPEPTALGAAGTAQTLDLVAELQQRAAKAEADLAVLKAQVYGAAQVRCAPVDECRLN